MDLDLRGDQLVGVKEFHRLIRSLKERCVPVFPETTAHQRDRLACAPGEYAGWA
jgi:hypothetical protein